MSAAKVVEIANAPSAELPPYFSDIYQHIDNDIG
jgi:hypothetical protein